MPHENDRNRIVSIDFVRGLVMIIMTLDHVRDYFHDQAFEFDPLDFSRTYPMLFFTRWITHFCAPVFVFLSGTSAYLYGQNKSPGMLSRFLFTRGLWLIFAELTIIAFGWFFDVRFHLQLFGVIWAIGFSMIALSVISRLPVSWVLSIGLLIVFGHNLLDNIHVTQPGIGKVIWAAMHDGGFFSWQGHDFMFFYPALPWVGVMCVGYALGKLYRNGVDEKKRRTWLITAGTASILLFVVIRLTQFYGDPSPWSSQNGMFSTLMSVLNTTKYPPSLSFLLMTLGPALLLLAWSELWDIDKSRGIVTIGRVPMFYYLIHIYAIHLFALFAVWSMDIPWTAMLLQTWVNFVPELKGYGFPLILVYIIWIAMVLMLYPLCVRYNAYKTAHKEKWWLSYL